MSAHIPAIKGKRILFCVLNWGLGHASRSIPIINFLQKSNFIMVCSDGIAGELLKQELPEQAYHSLTHSTIHYRYQSMVINMLSQLPKMISVVREDQKSIQKLVKLHRIDTIISDHRFGCWSATCHNIVIAHQLNIMASQRMQSTIATKLNHHFLRKYKEIWIPDDIDSQYSGVLSLMETKWPIKYIGIQSRFTESSNMSEELNYHACIILSGPEPNRSQLELQLLHQFAETTYSSVLVRGSKTAFDPMDHPKLKIYNLLSHHQLKKVMDQSHLVISRCGYSSIMDLIRINKPAILIPTPGQTEQEYLAKHLKDHPLFVIQGQAELNIPAAMEMIMEKHKLW